MTRAALFDLDGTLVDLLVDIEAVRRRAAALFEARGWRGELRPILSAIDEAAAAVEPDPRRRATLVAEARGVISAAELEAAAACRPRPGAAAVIEHLAARGAALAVVSNNSHASVERALERLGARQHVAAVVGRDDVERPKPDPAGLLLALERLGDPAAALWVGDRPADVEAGRRLAALRPELELEVIGVGELSGADRCVADLAELLG